MTDIRDHDDAFAYGDELLVGGLVRLRGTLDDDLGRIAGWLMQPAIRATQSSFAAPMSEAAARAQVAEWSANKGMDVGFSIETLDDSPTLVGHVGLFGANVKDRCGTVGILIGREFVGRGYGTDAMRLVVAFGFRELGLHRIQLDVYGYNLRAVAAYRKAGFVEEGRRREAVLHDGTWYDNVLMAIIDREWRAATA